MKYIPFMEFISFTLRYNKKRRNVNFDRFELNAAILNV